MEDHFVLCVDRLKKPEPSEDFGEGSCSHSTKTLDSMIEFNDVDELSGPDDEGKPLLQIVECRICQEEDSSQNMEKPCACRGSLKYAHRKCVQRWCNEKGDTTCEICHKPYQSGYTAPPPPPPSEDAVIDISGWRIHGPSMDLHDPQLLAMAAAERHLLEAEYYEYSEPNASGATFCRSAALILMVLLLLRHVLTIGNGADDDDAFAFFSLFLLRAAGFLLPCYIMAWVISMLQRRRRAQEAAAALAATEVAFVIHAGHPRGIHFAVAPRSPITTGPVVAPP